MSDKASHINQSLVMSKGLMSKGLTRKDCSSIRVYCLPDEQAQIKANAAAAGLSVSTYLRRVSMGYEIKGILDYHCVRDLAKINGDQGRLGGLLKLWLVNDPRTADVSAATLRVLLNKIEAMQDELCQVMKQVIRK